MSMLATGVRAEQLRRCKCPIRTLLLPAAVDLMIVVSAPTSLSALGRFFIQLVKSRVV